MRSGARKIRALEPDSEELASLELLEVDVQFAYLVKISLKIAI